MTHRVMVYGTLKRGHSNNYLLDGSVYLGRGLTVRRFWMMVPGFPVVLMNKKIARVTGEVYEVDDETLERLDRLEGNGHMYLRRQVQVLTDGGSKICWIYIGVHKFWKDRLLHLRVAEPVDGQYTWGGRIGSPELDSMPEIADYLRRQARGRSLENDEMGLLEEAADRLEKEWAEL